MTEPRRKSGRLQLLFIAAVFFGPLAAAAFLYYGGYFTRPAVGTNHGTLLEPIVSLADTLPGSPLRAPNEDSWVLLYMNTADCSADCRDALYTIRQVRKALGREMSRLTRVFLHGVAPPDTVFLDAEHEGLVTIEDAALSGLLDNKRPAQLAAGGYYLIDPLGNLVMYFRPDIDPTDMVDDIKHLLRLSRIG